MKCPLAEDRYVAYRETDLEKNFKYDLTTEVDVGVNLDMIDLSAYVVPSNPPPLDPADAKLLSGFISKMSTFFSHPVLGTLKQAGSIKVEKTPLPFLMKPQYITNEWEAKAQPKEEHYEDSVLSWDSTENKEKILSDILKSFEAQKKPPVHPTHPNRTPVEILPLFPDEELQENQYSEVVFIANPLGAVCSFFHYYFRFVHFFKDDSVDYHKRSILRASKSQRSKDLLFSYYNQRPIKRRRIELEGTQTPRVIFLLI